MADGSCFPAVRSAREDDADQRCFPAGRPADADFDADFDADQLLPKSNLTNQRRTTIVNP